jgi:hypothetical protein
VIAGCVVHRRLQFRHALEALRGERSGHGSPSGHPGSEEPYCAAHGRGSYRQRRTVRPAARLTTRHMLKGVSLPTLCPESAHGSRPLGPGAKCGPRACGQSRIEIERA